MTLSDMLHDSIRQSIQDSISYRGCRTLSIRQRMQEKFYETAVHEALYQIANVGVSISDIGCRIHSITQRMQKTLFQIADEGVPLSDSGFRRHSMTQRMQDYIRQHIQETCCQTADAGVSLSDSGYRRHSFRQRIRRHSMIQRIQVFLYLIADADDTHSESSIK